MMMGNTKSIAYVAILLSLQISSAWLSSSPTSLQTNILSVSADGVGRSSYTPSRVPLQYSRPQSGSAVFLNRNGNESGSSSTKKSQDEMVRFIERPITSTVGDRLGDSNMDKDLILQLEHIVKAADGRKAQDLVVLAIGHVSTLAQALVICSGNSRPQNQAIANEVQETMEDDMGRHILPEGNPNSGWMILDYGSIMVHIMTPKSRLFYNVEGQWRDKGGKDFRPQLVEQWIQQPGSSEMEEMGPQGSDESVAAEDDPFWS